MPPPERRERSLTKAETCDDCKKPADSCTCVNCAICKELIARDVVAHPCETSGCKNPFFIDDICLKKQLKMKKRFHVKCTCCDRTTIFSQKPPRTPIWRAACCCFSCDWLYVAKVLTAIVLLSFIPSGALFLVSYLITSNSDALRRSWLVWFSVSWLMLLGIFIAWYVGGKLLSWVSWPARRVVNVVTSILPFKRGSAEKEGDDVYIVAVQKKRS